MSVKSVIDIEVSDGEFKRFYETFQQFQSEASEMPDTWKGLGDAMGEAGAKLEGGAVSGREALALAAAQASVIAEALREATKAQDGLGIATKRSGGAMEALHKSARGVGDAVSFVAGGILKIAAFAGIGGILGGLGIGDLAASGFNRYKQSGELGISPGELASFQTNAQQFLGTSALEAAANAKIDITKSAALGTLGINYADAQGMKTTDLAFAIGQAAAAAYRQDAKNGTPALQDPRIFWAAKELGIDIDQIRNMALHPEALAKARRDTVRDARSMNFDEKTGQAWTEFKKELDRAGFQIDTVFINKLAAFAPVLERLTGDAADFIVGLANSKQFGETVHWAAGELTEFVHFLEGVNWNQVGSEVTEMGEEIGAVADRLKWLIPTPSGADVWGMNFQNGRENTGAKPGDEIIPWNPLDKNAWGKTWEAQGVQHMLDPLKAVGDWMNQPFGQTPMGQTLNAITGQESGGNYGATNKDSGASGRYQFMPSTAATYLPDWWKKIHGDTILGEANADWKANVNGIQDTVAAGYYNMLDSHAFKLSKTHGNAALIAAGWYGGTGGMDLLAKNDPRAYEEIDAKGNYVQGKGAYPSLAEYASSVASRASKMGGNITPASEVAPPSVNIDQLLRTVDADIAQYGKDWVAHLPKDVAHYVTMAHLPKSQTSDPDISIINETLKKVLKRRTPAPAQISITNQTGANVASSVNAVGRQ